MEEVEDSPDFWSGPVQSYNSPVQHRFLIGLDRSTNSPLPDYRTVTASMSQSGPCLLGLLAINSGTGGRKSRPCLLGARPHLNVSLFSAPN